MTFRHALLPIGAVLLLGAGVYLFYEVRAQPAIAQVDPVPRPHHEAPVEPPAVHMGSGIAPQVAAPPPVTQRPITQQIKEPLPQVEGPREVRFNAPEAPGDVPANNQKIEAVMDEANKAYDHGDFDEAKAVANKVLAKFPANVRMLRILVSASCIDGDTPMALANFGKLPAADQDQMRTRCARYGVTFPDKQ